MPLLHVHMNTVLSETSPTFATDVYNGIVFNIVVPIYPQNYVLVACFKVLLVIFHLLLPLHVMIKVLLLLARMKQMLLQSPHDLAFLKEIIPPLAEVLLSGSLGMFILLSYFFIYILIIM